MSEDSAHALAELPHDMQHRILAQLSGRHLGTAAAACTLARDLAPLAAREAITQRHPRAVVPRCPCWLRLLQTRDLLERAVGPRPTTRGWRDEWKAMRMEQAQRLAQQGGRGEAFEAEISMEPMRQALLEAFADGGQLSVSAEVSGNYAATLRWKREAGWPAEEAEACTLLLSCCPGALARALSEAESCYAASLHCIHHALCARALEDATVAPPGWEELPPAHA